MGHQIADRKQPAARDRRPCTAINQLIPVKRRKAPLDADVDVVGETPSSPRHEDGLALRRSADSKHGIGVLGIDGRVIGEAKQIEPRHRSAQTLLIARSVGAPLHPQPSGVNLDLRCGQAQPARTSQHVPLPTAPRHGPAPIEQESIPRIDVLHVLQVDAAAKAERDTAQHAAVGHGQQQRAITLAAGT